MKRDLELVRKILLEVEKKTDVLPLDFHGVEGYPSDVVQYHIGLIRQAGLLEGQPNFSDNVEYWLVSKLTWEGHEFLDAARSDTVWRKAIEYSMSTVGTVSLEVLKAAIPIVIKVLLSQAGLP